MRRPAPVFALCVLAVCAGAATLRRPATTHRAVTPPATSHRAARPPAATLRATTLAGTWRGIAEMEDSRLDLIVRFTGAGSTLRATLSSPDLLLLEQPLAGVQAIGTHVRFVTLDEHPLKFQGILAGDSLQGLASVEPVPGVIDRAEDAHEDAPAVRFALGRAPAPPSPPYATREVRFAAGRARLAGTLYLPGPKGTLHAGVVILQGSSTNLRGDFRFYADHFARAGLAVLVFDKRGNGESTGDYGAATYDTLARDAAAAVERLRAEPGVDANRIAVWGLSQGAFIAPRVAALVPALRCIVAVSAPGMPIGYSAAYQDSARLTSAGFDAADVARAVTINRRMTAWLETGRDGAELSALLSEAASTEWRRASSLPARLPSGSALGGWYWRGRTVDPEPWWRAVRIPVLAVYGAADELVPARPSAKAVERALKRGGNRKVRVEVFPSANHVLLTLPLVKGGKWDWPRAAPGYLELVTHWLVENTR